MKAYYGHRFKTSSSSENVKILLERNNIFEINGVEVKLEKPTIVSVKSHEEATKILGKKRPE